MLSGCKSSVEAPFAYTEGGRCATGQSVVSEAGDQGNTVTGSSHTRVKRGGCRDADELSPGWSYLTVKAGLIKRRSTGGTFVCGRDSDVASIGVSTSASVSVSRSNCGPGLYFTDGLHEAKSAGPGGLLRVGTSRTPDAYNN